MKNLTLYLQQGMTLTNGEMEFKYEYDDNGEVVVEIYNKKNNCISYISKELFEVKYSVCKFKVI